MKQKTASLKNINKVDKLQLTKPEKEQEREKKHIS